MARLPNIETRSDKGHPGHGYLEVYESLFAPIRATVTDVLELGVWDGDSIQLWRNYFGPKVNVTGYDIQLKRDLNCDRDGLTECNAYSMGAVEATPPQDVIVDDGPHDLASMMFAVDHYLPLVKPGGVFVIEDVPHPNWIAKLYARVPEDMRRHTYGIDRTDYGHSPINDDRMFVVDLREWPSTVRRKAPKKAPAKKADPKPTGFDLGDDEPLLD